MRSEDVPDEISAVSDSILDAVIECSHGGNCTEQCSTAFRVIPAELDFYRRMGIPLPTLCPNCRHYQRVRQRNPLKLWGRNCMCSGVKAEKGGYDNAVTHFHSGSRCPNVFQTSYSPERKEIVYCEQCYQAEAA